MDLAYSQNEAKLSCISNLVILTVVLSSSFIETFNAVAVAVAVAVAWELSLLATRSVLVGIAVIGLLTVVLRITGDVVVVVVVVDDDNVDNVDDNAILVVDVVLGAAKLGLCGDERLLNTERNKSGPATLITCAIIRFTIESICYKNLCEIFNL
uniref:Uncharacterized protein n=1 Tax=Glossina palpalis gambiensis TaxID=67801 RepID=A0A1B0BCF7_9MUSC